MNHIDRKNEGARMTTRTQSNFDLDCIPGGPFGTNAYIVADPATRNCAIVDPGYDAGEIWGQVIRDNDLNLEKILLTHGHIDHTAGVADLLRAFPGTPVLMHKDDEYMLQRGNSTAAKMFGLPDFEPFEVTEYLEEGKPVSVGEIPFEVIHLPGHSPGSVAFLNGERMLSGDLIIQGSIGRTDLPGGDMKTLIHSIVHKMLPLGDNVILYSGHGETSTIGIERMQNYEIRKMLDSAK